MISSHWDAVDGLLYCFERAHSNEDWKLFGSAISVTRGKKGMAWGRGIENFVGEAGVFKQEGDSKSPAGVFLLGSAFGDALHRSYARNFPFIVITEDLECVDDPHSIYYNQFVHRNAVSSPDWTSSEKMWEVGPLYALGIVVRHNDSPVETGKGSAIFMHIWRGMGEGTQGCTAMDEKALCDVVSWLNQDDRPHLVQLPLEEYERSKVVRQLPNLPSW